MNREILFRGKRTDNGEWVYGCYMTDELDLSKAYIGHIFGTEGDGMLIHDMDIVRVVPETACQYTGLTDKNGRKIFEGDVVETVYDGEQNPNYVVIWDEEELDFKATNGKSNYGNHFEYLGCCDEIIVIGNIFDNPELLEA